MEGVCENSWMHWILINHTKTSRQHIYFYSNYGNDTNPTILFQFDFGFEFAPRKSNSNSLAYQLGIHLILAKREKMPSNSLTNQLGKNKNLAKLTSPRAYMRARIVLPSAFSSRWEGEKGNKE
jgi:hypothetical protein